MLRSRRPILTFLIVAALLLAGAHALDRFVYTALYNPRVYDQDWGRMLRTMGYLPFWLIAALALGLQDGWRWGRSTAGAGSRRLVGSRAGFLFLAPVLAGALGELLKLLIRRERPWAAAGAYVFRPFTDRPFSGSGLAMPSSHAVVAFAAAFALGRLFPRAAPVWYVLAAGCAFTRMAARAHFLSDVVLGALLAWAVIAALWRWAGPRPDLVAAGASHAREN